MRALVLIVLVAALTADMYGQAQKPSSAFRIGRVKYAGGGDWYNDPSAEVNLLRFAQRQSSLDAEAAYNAVEVGSEQLFSYPFLFLTGHGNISFSERDVKNLRTYLDNGGFLYADDDYGMDRSFRREMKKVFPDQEFVEVPFSHRLYQVPFGFPGGPPKTHAHDEKPPKGYGLFVERRMVVFYTVESNPSDGWADPEVHGDAPEKREEALRFGTNILVWALTR
ncbi:MAG: DUF4159 domain-containing protein [Bacteroidetes bacterium]|nr:DUF4159 domain-containing protein [Bacteroidota bacterium]